MGVTPVIAQGAGGRDIAKPISASIASRVQVLCSALVALRLAQRQAVSISELFVANEPHGLVAVAAKAALPDEGRLARRNKRFAGHKGSKVKLDPRCPHGSERAPAAQPIRRCVT